jgi:hypothetical protein
VINVFFNSTGYYIEGEGTEIARSFSPSVDGSGRPMMEPLQHLYVVLACALKELRGCKRKAGSDIYIYNDSRLIEEMGNEVQVPDCVCREMKLVIRRKLLPDLPGVVFFRKKSADYIAQQLAHGSNTMLTRVDRKHLMQMVETMASSIEENAQAMKVTKIAKLKSAWFRNKTDD